MGIKVLLPIEGRRSSTTAEDYAIRLHELSPLSVLLVNVVDPTELDGHGINPDFKESILANKRRLGEQAVAEASEVFQKAGIPFERRMTTGRPATMICQIAESDQVDLVIIAESGAPEIRNIGSVTRTVLYECRKPVLLVKHPRK